MGQALSGAEDNMKLWDIARGGCLRTFSDVEEGCHAIAANWKESRAFGGCGDGKIKCWNISSGELVTSTMAHAGGVWAIDVHWERRLVASGGDEHFKLWSYEDWSVLHRLEGFPGGIMSLVMDWETMKVLIGVGARDQGVRLCEVLSRKHVEL